ncbi:MAG: hypothetical protein KME17_30185 [Cyanosarcina radialis HA8281-LM2]|nr:hypothetical protein [Cyanosarcina radialis HA8281-LM2]
MRKPPCFSASAAWCKLHGVSPADDLTVSVGVAALEGLASPLGDGNLAATCIRFLTFDF